MTNKFQIATYILTGLTLLLIVQFHFLPLLFAILITYIFIEKTGHWILWLRRRAFGRSAHFRMWMNAHNINVLSTILIIGVVCLAVALLSLGIYHFIHGNHIGAMLGKLSGILADTKHSAALPEFIRNVLPSNLDDIKQQAVALVENYGAELTRISKNSLKNLVYIILGIVIGAMLSFHSLSHRFSSESMPLFKTELIARIVHFKNSFAQVFLAQAKISAVNTLLTGIYLCVLLPLFGADVPFKYTALVVAFIVGLIPVAGNLISNTIIVILSSGVSLLTAAASLIFLVVIHKLEYFLNAKIIGSQIESTAWELLIVMIAAEHIFGIGGIVAAPIYYAYIKREMKLAGLI
ncbi:AI-2E family transporter [Neisseria perflava]|uniref:AI-2E family transporter n=1 Tax=Neisseria perflava TaxID=33053 RepID=UPI0020A015A7|nr:hypothetical protein [Neisseria perflava]MCP1661303.1 putative PurR-regulated permease PerM [Neisseria perflava]